MKIRTLTFVVFMLVVIFLFPSVMFAQRALTEVDLRINGIGEDSSYREVIAKFGRPLRVRTEVIPANKACSGESERHRTLVYTGMEIVLLKIAQRSESVTAMKITSGEWQASGIRLGDTTEAVVSRLGEPNSREIRDGRTFLFYVTPGNLGSVSFEFAAGNLAGISMAQTLC